MVQALGATVAHCIAHPGLAQQFAQVMNRYELVPTGCSELELLSSCSELQHKLFAELFVPSWIQAALKTVINCVFTFGIPTEAFTAQQAPDVDVARAPLQRLDNNVLDQCSNSVARFSNIRIICGSAASYISDVLPSNRLCEYYARCIKWYNAASSNLVGQQLEGSKCIWGVSDLHTDSNSGEGANMEWLKQLGYRPDDTIVVAGAWLRATCRLMVDSVWDRRHCYQYGHLTKILATADTKIPTRILCARFLTLSWCVGFKIDCARQS